MHRLSQRGRAIPAIDLTDSRGLGAFPVRLGSCFPCGIDSPGDTTAALKIRKDRTPTARRRPAKTCDDGRVQRRMGNRQMLRDWVLRFNAHGLDGLADQPREGRPSKLEPPEKATLAEEEHAVMVLDQAGRHGAKALAVTSNITVRPLPPYSPELNPVARVWLRLKERFLCHRLHADYEAIVDAASTAWNPLRVDVDRLTSL